jgi:hypothetical protein
VAEGTLITHADCLDGATAALVGLKAGLVPHFVEPDRALGALQTLPAAPRPFYLADVSIKAGDLPSVAPEIGHILDHHQSALPLASYPRVTIDLGRSGCHLMYDYAVAQGWIRATPAWDRLVLAVEDYDLWRPFHSAGQNLGRLFRALGFTWYQSRFGEGWTPYTAAEATRLAEIIAGERQFVARQLSRQRRLVREGLTLVGILLDAEGPTNEIAHHLIEGGADLVVMVRLDGRISARSGPRVDVARLAADRWAGGGHRRAAGGRLPSTVPHSDAGLLQLLDDALHALTQVQGSR